MGKKVGKFTGNYTQTGRKIYRTSKGEDVSEKSRTIPFDKGKTWVNVPSIHSGKIYSEDELRSMLKSKKIKPTSIFHGKNAQFKALEKAGTRSHLLKAKENSTGGFISVSEYVEGIL